MVNERDIFKDAIIGWLVIRSKDKYDDELVEVQPMIFSWDGVFELGSEAETDYRVTVKLNDDTRVIGVVPALPGSYIVSCCPEENDGWCFHVGYELPGAYHPDWVEQCKEKLHEKIRPRGGR